MYFVASFLFFNFVYSFHMKAFFFFLAVLRGLQNLSSPTRDGTRGYGSENAESYPLDCQGTSHMKALKSYVVKHQFPSQIRWFILLRTNFHHGPGISFTYPRIINLSSHIVSFRFTL